jgi:hypothetical protein
MTDKQIVKKLHEIDDRLDALWGKLYDLKDPAFSNVMTEIHETSGMVLDLSGAIIAESKEF